jgi:hypothetical protein
MMDHHDLRCRGDDLHVGRSLIPAARLIPSSHPLLFRVQLAADGTVTDMINETRARDAAVVLVLAILNRGKSPLGAPPVASNGEAA